MSDGFEYTHYGHPTDNTDGTGDVDLDGVNDRDEIAAETDPDDPASLFRLTDGGLRVEQSGASTSVHVEWHSQVDRTYQLWKRTSLTSGGWVIAFADVPGEADGITERVVVFSGDQGYVRVSIDPK